MSESVHPVSRGKTYYGESETIDVSSSYANTRGGHLLGQVKKFRNVKGPNDTTDPKEIGMPRNNNADDPVVCMFVRNESGITLKPCHAVSWASGKINRAVGGYYRSHIAQPAGFVDDHYGSAGVRDGDSFWMVIRGQCLVKTANTNSEFDIDIAAGAILFGVTSAAANATTTNATLNAGRVKPWKGTFSAAETTDGTAGHILTNYVARAITACTTNGTDAKILVEVKNLHAG